jgi:hypothetical protein
MRKTTMRKALEPLVKVLETDEANKAADSAGEVEIEAIPTKKWNVDVEFMSALIFSLTVDAETAEDAKLNAYKLVETEAERGGHAGVLALVDHDYDLDHFQIETYDGDRLKEDWHMGFISGLTPCED